LSAGHIFEGRHPSKEYPIGKVYAIFVPLILPRYWLNALVYTTVIMSLSGPFINQEITTTNPVVGHDSRWNSNKRKFSEVRIFSPHVWVPQINSLYED
jgi:hypothetical protein